MSLFSVPRKKRSNYRRVVHSIDSDTEEQNSSLESKDVVVASVAEKSQDDVERKKNSSSKLLSYLHDDGDDVDEDVTDFKLKKPDYSKLQQRLKRSQRNKEKMGTNEKKMSTSVMTPEVKVDEDLHLLSQVSRGVIPNAAAIHAARKRRELARNTGAESGSYIGLSSSVDAPQQQSQRSNEEDDDISDEESDRVRQFGVKQDTTKQMEVLSAMDNAESGSDEDKFEEEQIHKGSYAFPTPSAPESQYAPVQYEEPVQVQRTQMGMSAAVLESDIKLTPISIESIQSQLRTQLNLLHEQHSSNDDSIRKLSEDLEGAHREIEEAESKSLTLSMRYQFFQETKGYVKDLLLCLTEKVPRIKELEDGILSVLKQKADLLIERRRQDVEDAVEECAGKLDPMRQSRIVEREGRRRRRRETRSKVMAESTEYYEGQSSDDELLESTKMKFKAEIDEVLSKQGDIFSDVLEDFSSISQVIMRFREWKYNFSESYDQAYISLCLPKLLVLYVQLELIPWRPNSSQSMDVLEYSAWMDELLFFVEQYKCENETFDSDVNIIPRIVELTVIPKLTSILHNVWDPLSSTETECITKLIRYLIEDFPSISLDCRSFQNMSRAITRRMKEALQNDVYVPMFPQEKMQDSSSLQYKFSQRQFWSSYKLLKNLLLFHEILNNEVLVELVIDGLINRYMLLSLQNTPVSTLSVLKLKKVFALLPSQWWCSGTLTKKHFAGLVRYIGNLIEILQKTLLTEPEFNKQNMRNSIKQAEVLLLKATRGLEDS